MYLNPIIVISLYILEANAVRLHEIFQFIDGYKSEHKLKGFLHVGEDYAVFLRKPKPHDKYLVYELYETKNTPDIGSYKPRMLAISKVPIDYIKEQLQTYRAELYKAKYVDENIVPGTEVQTLREWQIDRALNFHKKLSLGDKMHVLRSVLR
ncbi:hypothetical protein K1T71_007094 [Dendrolimus kikuchii]|uniref:Uncharacterized protein n=1 Tax=Dendrolimus kikuchii TaxID=765133 RepID=A0ACC1CZU1_9NEOP|nr:hypothetical protein K1T71_007094 [Dendrolimus kikuchii]